MFFFGHIGITLGTAIMINRAVKLQPKRSLLSSSTIKSRESKNEAPAKPVTRLGMSLTDIVFCTIGSILPDLIDKPVGEFFFAQTFGQNGRVFSHTVLFLFIWLAVGLYFYLVRKKLWLLYIAFGVFTHLVLDAMWQTPQTLFWPILGWRFPISDESSWVAWLADVFQGLTHNPATYIPEIFGLVVIIGIIPILVKDRLAERALRNPKKC